MTATWVVVADNSRARIFAAEKPASALIEIQDLAHPEARLHERDLTSDRPGRDRQGGKASHGVGDDTDHRHENALRFAATVCETLELERNAGRFNKLYMIAAPSFLGLLRKCQSSATRQIIAGEIDKNLSTHDVSDIRKYLPKYL